MRSVLGEEEPMEELACVLWSSDARQTHEHTYPWSHILNTRLNHDRRVTEQMQLGTIKEQQKSIFELQKSKSGASLRGGVKSERGSEAGRPVWWAEKR